MNQIFKIAHIYYSALEKIGIKNRLKDRMLWYAIISWIVFGYQFAQSVGLGMLKGIDLGWEAYFLTLAAELVALYTTFQAGKNAKNVAIKTISEKYKKKFDDIIECRKFLLADLFKQPQTAYLAIAKDIDSLIGYHLIVPGDPTSTTESWLGRLIFQADAKPRIIAMLLVIASGLLALSIKANASIDDVFAMIFEVNTGLLILVWVLLTIFLWGALVLISLIRLMALFLWHYTIIRLDGESAQSTYTLRYLQKDLARFYLFDKVGSE